MSSSTVTKPAAVLAKHLDVDGGMANGVGGSSQDTASTRKLSAAGQGGKAGISRPFSFNLRKMLNRGNNQKQQQAQLESETNTTATNGNAASSPKANGGAAGSPSSSRSLGKGNNLRGGSARTPQSPFKKDEVRSVSSPRSYGGRDGGSIDADGISLTLEEASMNGNESVRTLGSILQSGGRDSAADQEGGSDDELESSPDKNGIGGDHSWGVGSVDMSPGRVSVKSDKAATGGGGLRPGWKNGNAPVPPLSSGLSGRMIISPTSPIADGEHLSDGSVCEGTEDQGYWSDETGPSLVQEISCGTEKCTKERRRLLKLIDELKQKVRMKPKGANPHPPNLLVYIVRSMHHISQLSHHTTE